MVFIYIVIERINQMQSIESTRRRDLDVSIGHHIMRVKITSTYKYMCLFDVTVNGRLYADIKEQTHKGAMDKAFVMWSMVLHDIRNKAMVEQLTVNGMEVTS